MRVFALLSVGSLFGLSLVAPMIPVAFSKTPDASLRVELEADAKISDLKKYLSELEGRSSQNNNTKGDVEVAWGYLAGTQANCILCHPAGF
ncbi:hypothetical protein [Ochrobactrum sp. BTU1]|uniref:hypothetical protein n=1 Tax=Ochrobactrum sp. BTU1 TaxID=2840456 RepID=UPI001C0506AE|nr:hypothetical protein KMS41_23375 [Ochrobactrum sp. BTU1]